MPFGLQYCVLLHPSLSRGRKNINILIRSIFTNVYSTVNPGKESLGNLAGALDNLHSNWVAVVTLRQDLAVWGNRFARICHVQRHPFVC